MKQKDIANFFNKDLTSRFIIADDNIKDALNLGNPDLQFFGFQYDPGEKGDTHTHHQIHLTFIRSGKIRYTIGDVTKDLGAGDFVSILPDVPHSFEVIGTEPCGLLLLGIPPTL